LRTRARNPRGRRVGWGGDGCAIRGADCQFGRGGTGIDNGGAARRAAQ
jgi:hypothetical protein